MIDDIPQFDKPWREALAEFEREYIEANLNQVGRKVGKLAQRIQMERTWVYRMIKRLGIKP